MGIPVGDYRNPARREHFVYRIYDGGGRLLYVGCSMRPERRWREHRADRKRWTTQARQFRLSGPYNYETARRLEREALLTEAPLHGMTPQKLSAKARRDAWIKRELARLLPDSFTTQEYVDLYNQVARRAKRRSWAPKAVA